MRDQKSWPNGSGVIVPKDWVLKTIWGILGLLVAVFCAVVTTGFVLHAQQATNAEKLVGLSKTVDKIDAKVEMLPPKEIGVNTRELAVLRTRFDEHLRTGDGR